MRQMGLGIKCDGLVTTVIAGHVALATVDTQVFINEGHHLLTVIQVTIGTNTRQSCTNNFL